MSKVKEKIKVIRNNPTFIRICNVCEILIYIFLFSQMVLNLEFTGEGLSAVEKDIYLGTAMMYFLISILVIQRVKILNWVNLIAVGIIGFFAYRNLVPLEFAPDLYNVAKFKWICGGLMLVSLIDMIMYKKISTWKERDLFSTLSFGIIAILAYLLSGGVCYSHLLLFPIVCLFLLRIKKQLFHKWIFCFTIGYYMTFVYTMIKSFVQVPFTGERYYGIYGNHGVFGMFIGGAFICALWWLILTIKNKAPIWLKLIIGVLIGFTLFCLVLNGARVAESAVLVVGALAICIWGGEPDKKKVIWRIVCVSLGVVILLVCGITALYVISTYEKETLELVIENDILREKLLYLNGQAKRVFGGDSVIGIFDDGSLLNALDQLSSWRLSYWVVYLDGAGWEPATFWSYDFVKLRMDHPHNIYIYWIYGMGYIPGGLMVAWTVIYLVRAIQELMRKNEVCILTFLWLVYFMVAGLTENPLWIVASGYAILILYYPLMMKRKKGKQKRKEK